MSKFLSLKAGGRLSHLYLSGDFVKDKWAHLCRACWRFRVSSFHESHSTGWFQLLEWGEPDTLESVFLLPLCSKLGKSGEEKNKIKDETTLNRMRKAHLSFGCSFRLFFILSELVVPPLITTVLRHSWVWSLEILKWAKMFSYAIFLKCISVDCFKWLCMALSASSPAPGPVFAVASAQKGSFLLNLSLSTTESHLLPAAAQILR